MIIFYMSTILCKQVNNRMYLQLYIYYTDYILYGRISLSGLKDYTLEIDN